jgi:hypothetical protein
VEEVYSDTLGLFKDNSFSNVYMKSRSKGERIFISLLLS